MSSRLSADIYSRPLTEQNLTSGRHFFWTSLRCPLDFLPTSTYDLIPNGTRHRNGTVLGYPYDVLTTFYRYRRTTSYQTEPDIGTIVFGHHNDVPKQFRFDVGFRWIRGWTLKAVESREDIVRMSKNNSVLMSGSVR